MILVEKYGTLIFGPMVYQENFGTKILGTKQVDGFFCYYFYVILRSKLYR
jgi:hypothetical protein